MEPVLAEPASQAPTATTSTTPSATPTRPAAAGRWGRPRASSRCSTVLPSSGGRSRLWNATGRLGLRNEPVRVQDVLARCALVEVLVALRGIVERDDGGVHRLGDLAAVVED